MTNRTARLITLAALVVMLTWIVGINTGWMVSRSWSVLPLAFALWMFFYAYRALRLRGATRHP